MLVESTKKKDYEMFFVQITGRDMFYAENVIYLLFQC